MPMIEIVPLVAEILEVPADSITSDSDLEDLGWDSLSNLTFISIVDERLGTTVDPEALARAETPSDLAALLPVTAR